VPVFSSPTWSGAQAGIIGDAAATAGSAEINQQLTTHQSGLIFQGNSILTPNGAGASAWAEQFSTLDIDQPFTMSGTAVGRVAIPLLAVGDGADLLVSLCADNSGTPGAMITQTRIPASWITHLSSVTSPSVPVTDQPVPTYTQNPLAAAQFNPLFLGAQTAGLALSLPSGPNGAIIYADLITFTAGYVIFAGGVSTDSATSGQVCIAAVNADGTLSPLVPQPSMPTANDGSGGMVVQTDPTSGAQTLVVAGGRSSSGGAVISTVYTAPFDGSTGTVSGWSLQAALPTAISVGGGSGIAAWGSYVYIAGGNTSLTNSIDTVFYAEVENGQISAWQTGTPLPVASGGNTVAVNGFLVSLVAGSGAWYAPINADGSIGQWRTAPYGTSAGWTTPLGTYGLLSASTTIGGLSFAADGPDSAWQSASFNSSGFIGAGFIGAGTWQAFQIAALSPGTYSSYPITLTPRISVPLPATGLSNGATYHVLIQQQGGDLNNYLRTHYDVDVFPGNPTLLTSARGAYAWTAAAAGRAVPIQVFDQSVTGSLWHSWDDLGARVTTPVYATTPDQRLLGLCEATRMGLALNANQGFETGIAPWTPTNCTAVQSSTEVFEGQYAAKITPNGTSPSCSIASEILPCMPGQAVTAAGRFWFTNAVTSNFSLSITWYPAVTGGSPISTTASLVSVGAGAWTAETGALTAPGGAYGFTIVPTLSGTPAAAQIWFADNVYATYTHTGPQQSSVVELQYPDAWPGLTWPPLGILELA
jgi:hypothetical protein